MNLKQNVLYGVKWTSLASAVIVVVGITQLSILTYYLSPKDYGLMAIVLVVIGFSRIFSDMGISNAIIHKEETSHRQLSSLYWLNIASGVALFFIIALLSPLIASFYHEPELISLLRIVGSTFIIIAFGNQYRILFQKDLRFNIIAKVEIISALMSLGVAIVSAVNGLGVYALVNAVLSNAAVSNILFVLFGLKMHRPAFIYDGREIRDYLNFGLFQMGENSLNYFNSQFDIILIGKLLGPDALGIYSVAKNLSMRPAQMINPIITRVTFPIMAKVQHDTQQLKNIYLKTIHYLSSVNFPIYIAIAILAEPIVLLLFDEKWKAAATILQILSLYGMVRSIGNPIGSLQLAKGRADMGFYWNLAVFFIFPLTIYIGSHWGLTGIAYSMLILMSVLILSMWHFMVKPLCGAGFTEYLLAFLKPMILAIIAGIPALYLVPVLSNIIVQILLVGILVTIIYGVLLKIYDPDFIATLKEFKK